MDKKTYDIPEIYSQPIAQDALKDCLECGIPMHFDVNKAYWYCGVCCIDFTPTPFENFLINFGKTLAVKKIVSCFHNHYN